MAEVSEEGPFFQLLASAGGSYADGVVSFSASSLAETLARVAAPDAGPEEELTVDAVLDDFERLLEEDQAFFAATMRATTAETKSVARAMLLVPSVQGRLITMFLEKLMQLGVEAPEELPASTKSDTKHKLLIRQLKWMEVTADGQQLANQVSECMSSLAAMGAHDVLRELLGALPEIVDAAHHAIVVKGVAELVESDRDMIVPAIDSLCNLRVDDAARRDLVRVVLGILRSATVEDLPVVVRYLLQCVPVQSQQSHGDKNNKKKIIAIDEEEARKESVPHEFVVWEIRERMASLASDPACKSGGALVLDAIKCGLMLRSDVAAALFRSMGGPTARGTLGVFDVWVLLMLRSCEQYRPKVNTILKQHISVTGQLTPELLEASLRGHKSTLADACLGELLDLAGSLLRSSNVWYEKAKSESLREFGMYAYIEAFKEFGSSQDGAYDYLRQEIVHALTVHCGTFADATSLSMRAVHNPYEGSGGGQDGCEERDTALSVLRALCGLPLSSDGSSVLRPYKEFLYSLVDHCIHFTHAHIRTLFYVLAKVSCKFVPNVESVVDPELHILLRKHLSLPEMRLRIAGIIGVAQLVCVLMPPGDDAESVDKMQASKEAEAMLASLFRTCASNVPASVVMYEELAVAVERGELHERIVNEVARHATDMFEHDFIMDADKDTVCDLTFGEGEDVLLRATPWMDHDDFANNLAVSIMPQLSESLEGMGTVGGDKLRLICPAFRCMMACDRDNSGGSFDALFGCGIMLPGADWREADAILETCASFVLPHICTAFFHAVNWVREVLNAFAGCTHVSEGNDEDEDDDERAHMRAKVCARLSNLWFSNSAWRKLRWRSIVPSLTCYRQEIE